MALHPAIKTAYHSPNHTKGPRIVATCTQGRIEHGYDHALSDSENHRVACDMLRRKLGWTQANGYMPMVGGDYGSATYWVLVPRDVTDENCSIV